MNEIRSHYYEWSSDEGESYSEAKESMAWFLGYIIASTALENLAPADLDGFFDDVARIAKERLPQVRADAAAKAEAKREAAN